MQAFHHISAPWTYHHKASSTYRTLDRFLLNTSLPALHVLGMHVLAHDVSGSPPARGDHWPISLRWSTPCSSEPRLGPHAHKHPQWKVRLHLRLTALPEVSSWRHRWLQHQGALVDTVDELAHLPRVDVSNAGTCYWTALRALRLFQLGH
eukprot:3074620-Amphidinium_carterae.1